MSTVNSLATTFTDQITAGTSGKSSDSSAAVDKEEFLNLLVAQLKNQDPMNPVDNEQFLTQLATFSSLEQLISINESVSKLAGVSE
jgi:flagellar basal-body rod modification protein FlgD